LRRLLPPQHLLLLLQNPWLLPLPQPRLNNPLPQNRPPPQPLLRNLPQLPKPHLQPSLPNPPPMLRQAQQPKQLRSLYVVPMPWLLLPQNLSLLKNLP
jgi:hypothetical protein